MKTWMSWSLGIAWFTFLLTPQLGQAAPSSRPTSKPTARATSRATSKPNCFAQQLPKLLQEANKQPHTQQFRFLLTQLPQRCKQVPIPFQGRDLNHPEWRKAPTQRTFAQRKADTIQQLVALKPWWDRACPALPFRSGAFPMRSKYTQANVKQLLQQCKLTWLNAKDIQYQTWGLPLFTAVSYHTWLLQKKLPAAQVTAWIKRAWLAQSQFQQIPLLASHSTQSVDNPPVPWLVLTRQAIYYPGNQLFLQLDQQGQLPKGTLKKKRILALSEKIARRYIAQDNFAKLIGRTAPKKLFLLIHPNANTQTLLHILHSIHGTGFTRPTALVGRKTIPFTGPMGGIPLRLESDEVPSNIPMHRFKKPIVQLAKRPQPAPTPNQQRSASKLPRLPQYTGRVTITLHTNHVRVIGTGDTAAHTFPWPATLSYLAQQLKDATPKTTHIAITLQGNQTFASLLLLLEMLRQPNQKLPHYHLQ